MEVQLQNGEITNDKDSVLSEWKNAFYDLLNANDDSNTPETSIDSQRIHEPDIECRGLHELNDEISIDEVQRAVRSLKMNKAVGVDEIPAELFKNVTVIPLLHKLFNKCFFTGIIPEIWAKANMMILYNAENVDKALVKNVLYDKLLSKLYDEWSNNLNKTVSQRNGNGGNKLRIYRTFKTSLHTEEYMHKVIVPSHRRAYICTVSVWCCSDPPRDCPLYDDLRNEILKLFYQNTQTF
ncbi:Hypothetical predicted protein [Mytilus galloprovincialis]|uniref:Reverse transcriptase domain-containing protein n=1 Tax=Mytilus galloprovincialis TaxID=29158 RepID=A0A8B6H1Y0_MYTGA|nr:Hypothetical predicted protein [Mytilus galloprovincialis]